MSTKTRFKPFHESVVDVIKRCGTPSSGRIIMIMEMLQVTKIPSGHDVIIAALDEYWDFPGSTKWAKIFRQTKDSLLEQKNTSEQKPVGKEEPLTHDNLQVHVDRVHSLLHDRQPELSSWHTCLNEELSKLQKMLSIVFK